MKRGVGQKPTPYCGASNALTYLFENRYFFPCLSGFTSALSRLTFVSACRVRDAPLFVLPRIVMLGSLCAMFGGVSICSDAFLW
jgi:hypothetical protein